jgi:hypothetical protein
MGCDLHKKVRVCANNSGDAASEPGPERRSNRRYSAFRKNRLWFVSHYYCSARGHILGG